MIAITVVIAVGTVLLMNGLTGGPAPSAPYLATTIILDPPERETGPNLNTVAGLATIEEVTERVANRLGFTGDPQTLAERVRAVAHENTELMQITARARGPREAKLLADTFAEELLGYLRDERSVALATEVEQISADLAGLARRIVRAEQRIDAAPADLSTLRAQRQALLARYEVLAQRYEELGLEDPATDLHVVQEAIPLPSASAGSAILRTLTGRLALATLMALVVAVGLVVLFERLPRRVAPKRRAEGLSPQPVPLPVLGDVPLARHHESPAGVTASEPKPPRDDFRYLGQGNVPRKRRRGVIRHRRRSEGPVS